MPRDLPTPPPERLFLPGPAGRLDATFELPAGAPRGAVLHLHPHPLGGGTRQNNVVRHGALGSLEAGCAAVRFDFRGVGQSEGRHDEGRGEVEDAAAVLQWLRLRVPGVPSCVWGFSFGARVGAELCLGNGTRVAGYMGVAWPTALYIWPQSGPRQFWPARMAFLAGDRDDFVDLSQLRAIARERGATLVEVPGADHFFSGRLDAVRAFTADTLRSWLPA
ncbi:MAG: alpha/beta fold hydrolase [Planctomycetota bacterium]|nr:MAG: alpha/beta fold hydrolase [Planctomycetota bacterium]